jgi:hypothetical protein
MKLRVIGTVSFLLGGALFVKSMTGSVGPLDKTALEPESFVVQYIVSFSENGGPLTPKAYYKRVVRYTGEWKETRYSFDGRISSLVGARDGLFLVSGNSRQLVGESNLEFTKSSLGWSEAREREWDRRPGLLRTEELAGLKTYVVKSSESNIEISYALRTGVMPLKTVIRENPQDATPLTVIEAIDVEFKEVSEEDVQAPPHFPIRFDLLAEKISALRTAGRERQAEMFEQTIQRIKAAKQQ